ncbi:MAG: beta-1,6-N-acetylglucosaminyltransferase [Paracoccus sp. (in: a-proteobacteria)]|uniref:beta-1,6-N-acetylglucosaminyltransferase n=1 Tax=Paracoccus sp. TaxID=267 RepID=UPI0030038EED
MARIAFILLAHKDPAGVIAQARRLSQTGDYVVVHFDRRSPEADYRAIREALKDEPGIAFPRRRHRCGWGEWSLVAASLEALRLAEHRFPLATHFYMLSGDCMPIKSAQYTHDFLDRVDCDYIEAVDFFDGGWIKTGIRKERLIYRHWFNERRHKRLFYAAMALQQRLGLERPVPRGIQVMIGSQWWCLRRQTVEGVLALLGSRPIDFSRLA